MKILIVDDDMTVRELLRVILKDYTTFEADDGEKAVRMYQELKPDIVLMDLFMPKMDGIEATRKILEIDPEAVVIGVTAFHSNKGDELMKAGAKEIISKPFTRKWIVEAISRYAKV
ncbi:response regulator [Geoglobus acetivorans]|uniref:Response regulator n=1 Tax=Geoglobus acetivorans TaxID=565033 RepID=A0ABZ3H8Z3_GEOAI|nr:response regulator [Geoglobus acetivorans]